MRFELNAPTYRLSASGIRCMIEPRTWHGPAVAAATYGALGCSRSARSRHSVAVGVIPFESDLAAHLYIPEEVTWEEHPALDFDRKRIVSPTNRLPAADSRHYQRMVERAIHRINTSPLEKVVLARRITAQSEYPINTNLIYRRMVERDPRAYIYRADVPDGILPGGVLLGASPELVVSVRNRKILSWPLAGTAQRHCDPDTDQAAAAALLASKKDRVEHSYVTTEIGLVLADYADDICIPSDPGLVKTPNLWHLGTKITGTLRKGATLLELAYAMHPTPAVSGWPTPLALQTIAELEDFRRGWYAGMIGWTDAEGNGDWALVLRGGIIRDDSATLYAGAGIIADSDPEHEYAEVTAKLQTFASVLDMSVAIR